MIARLAAIEDGAIIRVAFFALLIGTASVLYVDFREMALTTPPDVLPTLEPILPPANPDGGETGQPMPSITTAPDVLESPLAITLAPGGELFLTGTIDPGAAQRFADEIAARGEYVKTVVLDSPGGSVMDALEIGALIQEKALATKVVAGNLCASSCPIIFASGAERIASPDAAIGVHQIYAASLGEGAADAVAVAGVAMADAQSTTAKITRHLIKSGIDPEMWLHALDTPPDRLYYFSEEELRGLKLVTQFLEN
ncbi:hypothetical protein VW35_10565 [Devosia soli]|uniref:Uncharacterized protein n=1 Tax=Devosia soli TaxID=361041 RepID=A0A0F5L9U7_9HYPH|nr:hypothetical protein VW35_10565 [Devosia soli]